MYKDTAICYTSDKNFIFGTIFSIRNLISNCAVNHSEIYLFLLDCDIETVKNITEYTKNVAVHVVPIDGRDHRFDVESWNETHVPLSALARFYVGRYLPERIRKIVYMDGDTLACSNLDRLLNFTPPQGKLAAAEDINFFIQYDRGKYGDITRSYLKNLGISGKNGYFNSGLIIADRKFWTQISDEALGFFIENSKICHYHDQSALNSVIGDRRVRISPKWNFQTPFRYLNIEKSLRPSLFHFTEFPKPWMGAVYPWGVLSKKFTDSAGDVANLDLPVHRLPARRARKLSLNNMGKALRLRTIYADRLIRRRKLMIDLMSSSEI